MKSYAISFFVPVVAMALSAPAAAQALYGSIVGNVQDESGGAVPNATVTIVNSSTGRSSQSRGPRAGLEAETRSVFDRYNIVSELDLEEAAAKVERHFETMGHFWAHQAPRITPASC